MYNILCVDSKVSGIFTLESLSSVHLGKYNVFTANNKQELLEVLLTNQIDLILFDIDLDGLDGFNTIEELDERNILNNTPIIFLITKKDEENLSKIFKYGVDYLSKPYDDIELLLRVKVHLKFEDTKQRLQAQMQFSQSVIDASSNIIFIRDDEANIDSVNKRFLQFFRVSSIKEFKQRYGCVIDLFMEYENYFSLRTLNNGKKWFDSLLLKEKNVHNDYNVLLLDTVSFLPRAFKMDVDIIGDTEKYVVTLTDITDFATKFKKVENQATYDVLTNVYNRSKFNELLNEHYNLYTRYKDPTAFAIFDIDFFKKVNDTYGHLAGDEVLTTFAATIQKNIRITDIFARWGGEEFTLLMPRTKLEDAFRVVDKLRQTIEELSFGTVGKLTCSAGVTQFCSDDTVESILQRADEALYEAKETGRNKVCKR